MEENQTNREGKGSGAMQWVMSSALAILGMIAYVHNFVYPRTEGEKLEQRVALVESNTRQDLKEISQKIDKLHRLVNSKRGSSAVSGD